MDITPYNAPEVNGTGEELSILMRSPWLHTKKILPCWGFFHSPFHYETGLHYEAQNAVQHQRDRRHDQHVGHLRLHVIDDVAAARRAGHDRRVRNGRAVVAEDCAAEDRAGDHRNVRAHIDRHWQANDRHDRHRAHRGAGCERQQHAQQERQRRQQRGRQQAFKHAGEVIAGIQRLDHRAHREAEEQHGRDRQH